MALAQNYPHSQLVPLYYDSTFYYGRNLDASIPAAESSAGYNNYIINFSQMKVYSNTYDYPRKFPVYDFNCNNRYKSNTVPSAKRRKFTNVAWGNSGKSYQQPAHDKFSYEHPSGNENITPAHFSAQKGICSTTNAHLGVDAAVNSNANASKSCKRGRSIFEEENDQTFLSKGEIERRSPSRKDGIDAICEAHLRYSYCAFMQNLGVRLDVPQPTIGTAMVLCHRFFVRRSHACHDRFLIATAALFLSAKSEETARPLNDVLIASSEILHNKDFTTLSFMLPADWFEHYREQVLEAEQLILTTLNFELNVQHPYAPLTSTLEKLGLAQTVLVNLALNIASEGLRSLLWLQFEPHQIAAGAAYLAAKFLNMDLASYHNVWKEFHTSPYVLKDIAQQFMELF